MKKKTTITTEMHEVWVIRPGSDSELENNSDIDVDLSNEQINLPQLPDPNAKDQNES